MKELIILLMIGISLSIDALSVSTCIGMCNLSIKKTLYTSLTVGLFHFIMPILGLILSYQINKILLINPDIILGIILLLLSLQLFIEYLKPTKKKLTLYKSGMILFALGVSLDSFTVGLGISAITDNLLLASTTFTLCSFSFTFLGLTIGKYINKVLNKYSYLIGTIFLFSLGLMFLCQGF